jgi:hypothetical protein
MVDEVRRRDAWVDEAGLPVYGGTTDTVGRRRRRTSWVASFAALIVLLAAFVWAMEPRGRTGRERTEASTASSAPASATDPALDRSISALAPTDGKASRRLPVRLTPDSDLVDGQVVGIHGSGFTPNKDVGIVTCTNAAQHQGSAACDLSSYALSRADAAGEVQGLFTIRRFITVAGQSVDCLNGAIDPAAWEPLVAANGGRPPDYPQFTCIGVIGELDDYDNSGGWPLALRGAVFSSLAPPPGANPGGDGTTTSIVPSPTSTGIAPAPPDRGRACPYPDPTFPNPSTPGPVPGSSVPSSTPATTAPPPTTLPSKVECDPIIL